MEKTARVPILSAFPQSIGFLPAVLFIISSWMSGRIGIISITLVYHFAFWKSWIQSGEVSIAMTPRNAAPKIAASAILSRNENSLTFLNTCFQKSFSAPMINLPLRLLRVSWCRFFLQWEAFGFGLAVGTCWNLGLGGSPWGLWIWLPSLLWYRFLRYLLRL